VASVAGNGTCVNNPQAILVTISYSDDSKRNVPFVPDHFECRNVFSSVAPASSQDQHLVASRSDEDKEAPLFAVGEPMRRTRIGSLPRMFPSAKEICCSASANGARMIPKLLS
jgi:hypothetical protein